jgi:hypothetical protein
MGGYGSGPQRRSQFQLMEHCAVLKTEELTRGDRQRGPVLDGERIASVFTREGQTSSRQEGSLKLTSCRFGGMRRWFSCPGCGRRCTRLFLPPRRSRYECSRCHGLRYRSQRLLSPDRWSRRAEKIVARLGGEADDGLVYKPRGMHWRTFHRLMDLVNALNDASIGYTLSRCAWFRRYVA